MRKKYVRNSNCETDVSDQDLYDGLPHVRFHNRHQDSGPEFLSTEAGRWLAIYVEYSISVRIIGRHQCRGAQHPRPLLANFLTKRPRDQDLSLQPQFPAPCGCLVSSILELDLITDHSFRPRNGELRVTILMFILHPQFPQNYYMKTN